MKRCKFCDESGLVGFYDERGFLNYQIHCPDKRN